MDVDDTLVLILEQIDSPISLIRAASTCRRWRRVIAEAGFLRRYRSLHGPLVAGDNYNGHPIPWTTRGHRPSFLPSSSIDARHFSLDFVVRYRFSRGWDDSIFRYRGWDCYQSWDVLDSRGSLLRMECIHETHIPGVFPDLIVCEPLTRRYKVIRQPPDFDGGNCELRGPYLVDGDEDEAGGRIGMSNFRVLCVLVSRNDGVARIAVFNAGGDTDATWSEEAIDHMDMGTWKNRPYPCEFPWPPVLQACWDR